MSRGIVHLVGAGPGDPGLLTIKGRSLIEEADVIVYDALVNPSLLLLNDDAEKIDVGKRGGDHTMGQEDINKLLCELGKAGRKVVRLKGGDPFLFGRGAEEVEALRLEGVEVRVVPGVSSAIAVPELAGIPVTHRDHSSMVTFVTGHERADRGEDRLNWSNLAACGGTIVILMGMGNIGRISAALIEGGLPSDTPAAVVTDGSTVNQRCLRSRLGDVAEDVSQKGLKAPGIIIIGDSVRSMDVLGDLG